MARSRTVKINTKPVASHYASDTEKIIEFTAPNGQGGLISFAYDAETGTVRIAAYRLDPKVQVTVSHG